MPSTDPAPATILSQAGAPVSVQRLGTISVVSVQGPLSETAGPAHHAVLLELAEAPAAVLCDLSGATGPSAPDALERLASLGEQKRRWPGTPIAVISPDPVLRRCLEEAPGGRHLAIAAAPADVWGSRADGSTTATVREWLPADAPSAHAARELVARACMDWGRSSETAAATLVVSELVTNAVADHGSDIEVSVARCGPRLRVAVRRPGTRPGRAADPDADTLALDIAGPAMMLVEGVSESWGVLPTRDDGEVVWAVLLDPAAGAEGPRARRDARAPAAAPTVPEHDGTAGTHRPSRRTAGSQSCGAHRSGPNTS
jgi:hypothetical protein